MFLRVGSRVTLYQRATFTGALELREQANLKARITLLSRPFVKNLPLGVSILPQTE